MTDRTRKPGPIADHTYETGLKWGAVGGVVAVGICFWLGILSVSNSVHVTLVVVLFPVYIVAVALVLGVWLGYETDERNLRRVTVTKPPEMESGEKRRH
jgi:choline-glycine betaine transporter